MTWADVARTLAKLQEGYEVMLMKTRIHRPELEGATRSSGLPVGQRAHWRFPPDELGRGLHIHEFDDHYRAHLDQVHPQHSLLRHLATDVDARGPVTAIAGFAVLVMLVVALQASIDPG